MRAILIFSLAALAPACGDRCEPVSRLDGGWAVYTDADAATVTGDNQGDYPWDEVFAAGWSEWSLTYVPATQSFQLDLDGQPFDAAYTPDDVDCDAFSLAFDGTWLGGRGSVHDFTWTADLLLTGAHLEGSYRYDDVWQDRAAGTSGSLTIQDGSFTANRRSGAGG